MKPLESIITSTVSTVTTRVNLLHNVSITTRVTNSDKRKVEYLISVSYGTIISGTTTLNLDESQWQDLKSLIEVIN